MKKANSTKVIKRRNGRFAVRKRGGGLLKADEKVKALQEAGKIKKLKPKAKAEAAAEG